MEKEGNERRIRNFRTVKEGYIKITKKGLKGFEVFARRERQRCRTGTTRKGNEELTRIGNEDGYERNRRIDKERNKRIDKERNKLNGQENE